MVPDVPVLNESSVPDLPEAGPAPTPATGDAARATKTQIRGSSLLLLGRMISLGTNFAVQILIVRHLSKAEYGVFAYALSVVAIGASVVTLGFDRSIGRFLPIYQERGQPDRILGSLAFALASIASLGVALVILVFGLQGMVSASLVDDRAGPLLVILILLAPIQGMDDVLMSGFAVFSSPRSIFFRRYVLNPVLRLAVVGALIFGGQGARFLAVGYVLTGAIGVIVYAVLFVKLLRREGILPKTGRPTISIPARELLIFTLPLLSTDLIYILMNSMDTIVLGAATNAETVASYRVIQPAAALNLIVLQSFAVLFTPVAARLFARKDETGLRDMYWQTAAWVAVASFPIFAVTFSLAEPLTVALFQERYASSAIFLAIISLGRYFDAALGFNGITVRVFGNIRSIVVVNLIAAAVNIILLLTLIPALGALGAALATTITLLIFNCLKQYALYRVVGISPFDRRYVAVYGMIVVSTIALLVVQVVVEPPLWAGLSLVVLTSFLVLRVGRSHLHIAETFPELARLPIVRRLI